MATQILLARVNARSTAVRAPRLEGYPSSAPGMKIATWNVNGIRARASQVRDWLERERPDVVCLQELKAEVAQIPEECRLAEYHAYWHGRKGYSGVSLQIRKELVAADPVYSHPPFDVESRIVQVELGRLVIASVYVPNGGKDYPAKLNFLTRLTDWARQLHAEARDRLLRARATLRDALIVAQPRGIVTRPGSRRTTSASAPGAPGASRPLPLLRESRPCNAATRARAASHPRSWPGRPAPPVPRPRTGVRRAPPRDVD